MKKRSLYLDCHTGISGDMVVAGQLYWMQEQTEKS